ncbi:hypothetical protein [Acinetobacter beijerinckii]|uniref:hypothetical protein n=1 Tax=Acinetobacter beijerinckii TaxID=262668 RepID=UPI003016A3F2
MEKSEWVVFCDVLRLFTPYILALIVYLVWHKQKGKEVIASEARNALATLNSMQKIRIEMLSVIKKLLLDFSENGLNTIMYESFEIKLNEFELKRDEMHQSIMFICDAKLDIKLLDKFLIKNNNIFDQMLHIKEKYTAEYLAVKENRINFMDVFSQDSAKINNEINDLKDLVLDYALYRK